MPGLLVVSFRRSLPLLALLLTLGFLVGVVVTCPARPVIGKDFRLGAELEDIFSDRAKALVTGEGSSLARHYDTTPLSGRFAYEHELARVKLIHAWLQKRKVQVIHLDSTLRVIAAGVEGDRAWASVCQHLRVAYRHAADPSDAASVMGTRTVHWLELVRQDGSWQIQRDWFWDPFKDDTPFTEVAELNHPAPYLRQPPPRSQAPPDVKATAPGRFSRAAAVAYADRYSGVRIGKSGGRYNQRYRDFTGLGGDCANYVSQVLSDGDGGAIPQDWVWFYERDSGSDAWLRADVLVPYLIHRGHAVLLACGDLSAVTGPTPAYPGGPVFSLEPGDIIGYEKDGQIKHVSVVVGQDASGYPVVNSHTGDRYHVPWDMGFDSRTKYWLLHIVY